MSTFTTDAAGVRHAIDFLPGTHIDEAARHVINDTVTLPQWFWFNGTFAPIEPGDTPATLKARWNLWREEYQHDPHSTIRLLERYARGGT